MCDVVWAHPTDAGHMRFESRSRRVPCEELVLRATIDQDGEDLDYGLEPYSAQALRGQMVRHGRDTHHVGGVFKTLVTPMAVHSKPLQTEES